MDWMKALGHLHTATTAAVKIKQGYDDITVLNELMALDRDAAMARLGEHVNQLQAQQFDEFEVAFVNFAVSMADYKQRIKAVELYAWLKIVELQKFGQWRGFVQWA